MLRRGKYTTSSPEETEQLGREFAKSLLGHETVAFFGDLGSGKTTFLKGVISELSGCLPDEITSPTFTYLHIYEGRFPIYHFDLWRITAPEQFSTAGFADYLKGDGVCCIEWAEKIVQQLPENTLHLVFEYQDLHHRVIDIGPLSKLRVRRFSGLF
jgi:tRNA threonylcarbamoyladenosine biosynthesis protein TsaE